ncbi:MAG: hypothetical protein A3J76_01475 [Candidatus Moranbacteria bacterium RBG_13_45_13]|nr:MAG: hypothetical protein A3J76_01475 [Candidatus Moranbacteria bacterium RBG_13_45_13]
MTTNRNHSAGQEILSKFSKKSGEGRNVFFRVLTQLALAAIIVFLIVVCANLLDQFMARHQLNLVKVNEVDDQPSSENPESGIVQGEENENKDELFRSENYQSRQLTFGGDVIVPQGMAQRELELYDIKSELLTTKDKDETKLIVFWKTTRLAKCDLKYQRTGEGKGKHIIEDKYNYSHSAVLAGLNPSTAYTFTIVTRDNWGNEKESEHFAFFSGAPNISIIDMLTQAARDTFGWAMKK